MPVDTAIKQQLRTLTRSFYDLQKLRIQTGNRIVRNFQAQLGQQSGMPLDDLSPEAKKILADLRREYDLLADALVTVNLKKWAPILDKHQGIITSPYEFVLAEIYVRLENNEERLAKEIAALVGVHPLWTSFLEGVRGVGPILAAIIISELDPAVARYPSSFWAYAGLDVAPDGKGRSRRSEHLVKREYINKQGQTALRDSITYNPWLRTKLLGVLGTSFMRAGGDYKRIYDDYKHRLENRPDVGLSAEERLAELTATEKEAHKLALDARKEAESVARRDPANLGRAEYAAESAESAWERAKEARAEVAAHGPTKLHRHAMSIRYMVKMFLIDLHREWREIEGLPPTLPYHEAKLGIVHHGGADRDQEYRAIS